MNIYVGGNRGSGQGVNLPVRVIWGGRSARCIVFQVQRCSVGEDKDKSPLEGLLYTRWVLILMIVLLVELTGSNGIEWSRLETDIDIYDFFLGMYCS